MAASRILERILGSRTIGTLEPLPGTATLRPEVDTVDARGQTGPDHHRLDPLLLEITGQAQNLGLDSTRDREVVRADQADPQAHSAVGRPVGNHEMPLVRSSRNELLQAVSQLLSHDVRPARPGYPVGYWVSAG